MAKINRQHDAQYLKDRMKYTTATIFISHFNLFEQCRSNDLLSWISKLKFKQTKLF